LIKLLIAVVYVEYGIFGE